MKFKCDITFPNYGGFQRGQAPFGELGGATILKAQRKNVIRRHCSLLTPLSSKPTQWYYTNKRGFPLVQYGFTGYESGIISQQLSLSNPVQNRSILSTNSLFFLGKFSPNILLFSKIFKSDRIGHEWTEMDRIGTGIKNE